MYKVHNLKINHLIDELFQLNAQIRLRKSWGYLFDRTNCESGIF